MLKKIYRKLMQYSPDPDKHLDSQGVLEGSKQIIASFTFPAVQSGLVSFVIIFEVAVAFFHHGNQV